MALETMPGGSSRSTDNQAAATFSLCRGGLLYTIGQRLGISTSSRNLWQYGIALALICWLPLVLLNILEIGLQERTTIPFLHSIGTHVRILLAIPMFFAAESLFDSRLPEVLRRILEVRLVPPEDLPRLTRALSLAMRRRDSWLVEGALMVLTGLMIWSGMRTDLSVDVPTWRATPDGGLTPAGWWYSLVSIPIFQFLLWRWAWRLVIWGLFLWRLSRLNLQLVPTHPDGAGGLGILGVLHVDLAPLAFASSAVLSSSYAEQILYANVPISAFAVSATAAVLGTSIGLLLPLMFFSPRLIDTRQRGLLEYGTLASHYTRAFAARWLKDPAPEEPLLGTADIQSLADLGNSFGLIRSMSIMPIALRPQVLFIVAAAALPFVPLILLMFPLDELIINSVKSLLNV